MATLSLQIILTCYCLIHSSVALSVDALKDFVKRLELKELSKVPSWYPPGKARFRFVQITDVHHNSRRERYLLEALSFVEAKVDPAFVVFTGDNSGGNSVSRQKHFRNLLEENLDCPFFVLRGDNWPRNFVRVFGSFKWSFLCGGICFIGSGLDADVERAGIGIFFPDTVRWISKQLSCSARTPVVYFQHENIQPPTFLDAERLDRLFEESGNVLLTMTGHLHVDLQSKTGRVLHVVAPALGPGRTHGFKVAEVYAGQIVIRTVEYERGRYRYACKYQRVLIPKAFRLPPTKQPPRIVDLKERPPRDTVFEKRLLLGMWKIGIDLILYSIEADRLNDLILSFVF